MEKEHSFLCLTELWTAREADGKNGTRGKETTVSCNISLASSARLERWACLEINLPDLFWRTCPQDSTDES